MAGVLVYPCGYGLKIGGNEISAISKKSIRITSEIMNSRGYKNVLVLGTYGKKEGYKLTEGETLYLEIREALKKLKGARISYFYEDCKDLRDVMDTIKRELLLYKYKKLVIICWKPHAKRIKFAFNKVCKKRGVELEVIFFDAPFGGNTQERLNSKRNWFFWNIIAWAGTYKYFLGI